MASQRMIRREKKRIRLVEKYASARKEYRAKLNDPNVDIATKFEILAKYEKMPADASHVRRTKRCKVTGRARGVYRKFGLARSELRRRFVLGEIPGLVKSSW